MIKQFIDQIGNTFTVDFPPKRIISLVPSLTEFLVEIGLKGNIVGITNYCVHPEELRKEVVKVGGTKNFNVEVIRNLSPDLIIASKEENTREGIEELQKDFPVWVSDIKDLYEALHAMQMIGEMTDNIDKSYNVAYSIKRSFDKLIPSAPLKVIYLIWRKPYMTVGGDTFINDMLQRCGFVNIYQDQLRYPEITLEDIQESGADLILLSTEPYPFKQKHIEELQPLLPLAKVILVDGEYYSWYGSRLLGSAGYFKNLLLTIH